MDPITTAARTLSNSLTTPFITRCRCGRLWNVIMERGAAGHAGCIRCSCEAELVSWSGNVTFNAIRIDAD
jgi:hypothetical protein